MGSNWHNLGMGIKVEDLNSRYFISFWSQYNQTNLGIDQVTW